MTPEVLRLRAELAAEKERSARLDEQLLTLQRANESADRERCDAAGGPATGWTAQPKRPLGGWLGGAEEPHCVPAAAPAAPLPGVLAMAARYKAAAAAREHTRSVRGQR